jgi:hypothetical protein
MRLGPATTIVLAMFGSFAIVLTAMIVLMRPSQPRRQAAQVQRPEPKGDNAGSPATGPARATAGSSAIADEPVDTAASDPQPAREPEPTTTPRHASPRGATPKPPAAGRELQRKLEQEQKEMRLLRAEMERRLRKQIAEREAKLDRLAGSCAELPPGEAAQALKELDDRTIAAVLKRMDREAALKIAAVLQRLGRKDATAF